MHLAYIRTRKPKVKATPNKDWMSLKYAKRLADNDAEYLAEKGITKEEYIQMILAETK